MNSIKNKNIVITGLQSWDIKIGSNCKNIALEFSKNNKVLYVNPASTLKEFIVSFFSRRNKKQKYVAVNPNLIVYYPACFSLPVGQIKWSFLFGLLNKINNILFAKEIRKALKKNGFDRFTHFCDSDIFRSFHLKELLRPEQYIYYTRDNLLAVEYWQTQGARIEPLHMKKADVVLSNSEYLAQKARFYNPNAHYVGQGCDVKAYSNPIPASTPADIAKINSPIIGYIGYLTALRLDIGILEHIANERLDWNIVLVGPEDEAFKRSKLHKLANVYFLGAKQPEELPVYLREFDVALNPQKLNDITIGNYPRKIDEYLAMGKPVVATDTPTMQSFKKHVVLANNYPEWVIAIEKHLKTNSLDEIKLRKQFALGHSWKNNVSNIYSYFKQDSTKVAFA